MNLIDRKEIDENGHTYIVDTYDNGTVNKYVKSEIKEKEPVTIESLKAQMDAMSRVQRGRTEINGEAITIAIDPVDPMAASVAMDVQGADAAYAYSISEEALTVMFKEKVNAFINWEVRG